MAVDKADKPSGMAITENGSRGLLDLPPEIWSYISHLAVTNDKPITFAPLTLLDHHKQPSVTKACKALRTEALAHFYTANTWIHQDGGGFEGSTYLGVWLKNLPIEVQQQTLQKWFLHLPYCDAIKHYGQRLGLRLAYPPCRCNDHEDCFVYAISGYSPL